MEVMQEYPIALSVVVLREEFDEWAVLYNPDTSNAVGINPVGVAIWKLLDGKHSITDIVTEVKAQFEEVPDTAVDDLTGFIYSLEERGFVVTEPAISP